MDEFFHPIRVYYENTDAGGVVYHAEYLKFFERTRSEWLRELGFEQDRLSSEDGILFVVGQLDIHYKSPARFNQLLRVSARLEDVRPASLVMFQQIHEGPEARLCCTARVRIGCVSAQHFKPMAIPQHIRRKIENAV